MRSSTILTIFGAGLAIASPLIKKTLVTEVVTDVVYEYVTETAPTSSIPAVTTVSLFNAWHQDSIPLSSLHEIILVNGYFFLWPAK
jgi:hypothetical protein